MSYGLNTIKYLKRNMIKLIPFVILPAIALAFTGNVASFITFFFNFDVNATSVWTVYSSFTMIGSRSWSIGFMSIFILLFFESLIFGAIDRHLKVGKFSFGKSFSTLNETVMIVVPVILIFVASIELVAFLNAVIIYFFQIVLPSVAVFVGILTTLLLYSGFVLVSIQFLEVIPAVLVVGYPINDACVFSTKLVYGKTRQIALNFLILSVGACIISALFTLFSNRWVSIIVDSVVYAFCIMYLTVFVMVIFFDLSGEPRRDMLTKSKNYLT